MGVQESLDFIVTHMATKDDVREIVAAGTKAMSDELRAIREELKEIRQELKDIRIRIDALEESSESHSGFSKEIDHVLQRVIAIEKRLGIKSKTPV